MERPPRTRQKPRSLRKPPKPRSPWPHIEELIESDGNITIGRVASIDCAAVATDEHNMLAALVRRKGETFLELMQRLDEAIQLAQGTIRLVPRGRQPKLRDLVRAIRPDNLHHDIDFGPRKGSEIW